MDTLFPCISEKPSVEGEGLGWVGVFMTDSKVADVIGIRFKAGEDTVEQEEGGIQIIACHVPSGQRELCR